VFIRAIRGNSVFAVNFGTVLDAVNADPLLCGIKPIKDSVIAHAELAESGQIFRHANEPTMNHASGIVREPLDFALHALAADTVLVPSIRWRGGSRILGHDNPGLLSRCLFSLGYNISPLTGLGIGR
jgi:hypothetical protein